MGDGEAGGEVGVVLGTYFHVLPGTQQETVNAITENVTNSSKKCRKQ